MDCGCKIVEICRGCGAEFSPTCVEANHYQLHNKLGPTEPRIEFCPLHASATLLRDACAALPLESFGEDMATSDAADFVDHAGEFFDSMKLARAALAASKGEKP